MATMPAPSQYGRSVIAGASPDMRSPAASLHLRAPARPCRPGRGMVEGRQSFMKIAARQAPAAGQRTQPALFQQADILQDLFLPGLLLLEKGFELVSGQI